MSYSKREEWIAHDRRYFANLRCLLKLAATFENDILDHICNDIDTMPSQSHMIFDDNRISHRNIETTLKAVVSKPGTSVNCMLENIDSERTKRSRFPREIVVELFSICKPFQSALDDTVEQALKTILLMFFEGEVLNIPSVKF